MRSNERRRVPEPDVPLPAARGPLRRLGAGRRARLPGAHRPDDVGRARHGKITLDRPARATRRCGSTTSRPTRTGASGSRRSAVARQILNQPAFEPFNGGELSPGPSVRDRRADPRVGREGRRDGAAPVVHVRRWGRTTWRSSTRLSMRVHGLDGLRVVDASVFPYITNGNIYAPVMMTAEKSADLILGNTPLEPRSTRRSTGTGRGQRRRRSRRRRLEFGVPACLRGAGRVPDACRPFLAPPDELETSSVPNSSRLTAGLRRAGYEPHMWRNELPEEVDWSHAGCSSRPTSTARRRCWRKFLNCGAHYDADYRARRRHDRQGARADHRRRRRALARDAAREPRGARGR